MAPISVAQTSFVGGEVSPSLYGRTKLTQYFKSVRTMRNFLIHPHGPASNRPGTKFVAETKDSSRVSRLIPFTFSVTQTYILEFGHQYMRVYKDGASVTEGDKTITGATQADPVVISSTAHGYLDGEWVIISGVVGMTELNGKTFVVFEKTDNAFKLKDVDGNTVDGTGYTAYSSGGVANRIYEITTTYTESDLALLKYEQSADVLYINHPSYVERQVTRTGHTSWTIGDTTFGAELVGPVSFTKDSGSGTGRTFAVTAVAVSGSESILSAAFVDGNENDVFSWDADVNADHYNFYERVNGSWGWLGYAGSNSFTVPELLNPDMEAAPPTLGDHFGSVDDYPGVSAFHEQRLVRARTNNNPQTLRGSVTGDFDNMNVSSPQREDDAYNFTISSKQVNEIRWLVSATALIIGTSDGIWQAVPGWGDAISFFNISMTRQNTIGVDDVLPILVDNSILFIGYSGERVYDLVSSADGYQSSDLSVLAFHLFKDDPIVDWCYQRHPDSTLWCVKNDGDLVGLTYFKEHEVWGWHRHDTDGTFEATARISTSAGVDEVYFIVNRTINGVTRRYVEILSERLPNEDIEDAFFVDCGLSYDGSPATIMTGLDHLEGEAVSVLADGLVITGHTVSGGSITLAVAASKVHVGLAYTSDLETLDFEFPTETGNTVQDKLRDVVSVVLRLENTNALTVGPDVSNLETVAFIAAVLFDGDEEINFKPGEEREDRVFIRNTEPLPVTINAIIARVDHGED